MDNYVVMQDHCIVMLADSVGWLHVHFSVLQPDIRKYFGRSLTLIYGGRQIGHPLCQRPRSEKILRCWKSPKIGKLGISSKNALCSCLIHFSKPFLKRGSKIYLPYLKLLWCRTYFKCSLSMASMFKSLHAQGAGTEKSEVRGGGGGGHCY